MKTCNTSLCSAPGCDRATLCKALCQRHYDRLRNNGDLSPKWDGARKNFGCTAPGCPKQALANQLCSKHLYRLEFTGSLEIRAVPRPVFCIADGCEKAPHAKGLCANHYSILHRRGTLTTPRRKTLDDRRGRMRLHYRDNKAYYKAKKLKRENRQRLATPEWLSEEQMLEMNTFYKRCPQGHHVDHVVPLNGETVSGLHVPWNLQYLTAEENRKKSNKF
jgi:hypothetical protein